MREPCSIPGWPKGKVRPGGRRGRLCGAESPAGPAGITVPTWAPHPRTRGRASSAPGIVPAAVRDRKMKHIWYGPRRRWASRRKVTSRHPRLSRYAPLLHPPPILHCSINSGSDSRHLGGRSSQPEPLKHLSRLRSSGCTELSVFNDLSAEKMSQSTLTRRNVLMG